MTSCKKNTTLKPVETKPKDIRIHRTPEGREPFTEWIEKLKDKKIRAAILARIDRLRGGNFGDYKSLGENLYELRIRYGAGYRVYFGKADKIIIVIVCGGSKSAQKQDIQRAMAYWEELKKKSA